MKKDRAAIYDSSRRNLNERAENDMRYETHSQASRKKEILFIDLARVDSYYNVPLEMRNKMLEITK